MASADAASGSSVLPALDGVRAVAILAVLAHHGSYGIVKGGFLGVDLFFVLSGFLITHLLVKEWRRFGRITLSGFYARRALRIVPPLVGALVLAQALGRFDWRDGALPILGFYANYVPHLSLGTMIHTWSLAVEEQFYVVWPLLFIGAMRYGGLRAAATVAIVVFIAALAARAAGYASGLEQELVYRNAFFRSDSLAAGCLIALVDRSRWRLPTAAVVWGFLAILGALCFTATNTHWFLLTIGFSLFALASALFIAALVDAPACDLAVRLASHPVLTWIGRRSYGIYLYHVAIFVALEPLRERNSAYNFLAVTVARLVATAVVAELSWRLVEAPALALKRYFYPKEPTTVGMGATVSGPMAAEKVRP